MKNWIKILKFTLKQGLRSSKFITSTAITGIIILIAAAVTNVLLSGAFGEGGTKVKNLKAVYIVNETDLSLDTDSFITKHEEDYPFLKISELSGISAEEAAADSQVLGEDAVLSLVLDITENEDGCNLQVFVPDVSNASVGDGYDFASDFKEIVKNAKIKSTGISEDKLNMAISDIRINEIKAEESEDVEETNILTMLAPMGVMLVLYFLILFYGQSIGQIVSSEKTSKLMEYLLTLSGPSGIIFGKVTAIFCEALIQIAIWIVCGFGGLAISNSFITRITGHSGNDLIAMFMEALPDGGASNNFAVLLILSIIAMLVAFLFYCFVSALFASFAATAEELTQTNSMSIMTMLFGFLLSMYIPLFTDNSKIGNLIVRLVPFTSAFSLPGDVICAKIGLVEFIIYIALLLFFTVLLAILTGRVYKNRLFKKGTKGIFEEIISAITGKVSAKADDEEKAGSSTAGKVIDPSVYENHDNAKKTFSIVGFALLALILGANAIGGLVGNVIANLMAAHRGVALVDVYEDTMFLTVNNIVCMYLIACPLCALVMKLADDSRVTVKDHITKNQYLRSIFMIFPIAIVLGRLSDRLASMLTGGEAENGVNTFLFGDNILAMIMVAILAPIFEELVFRKLIIDRTRRYGEMVAIMYSALAFGLFHCNLYQIFYAFVIGIILGYVYIRTGNVLLTIFMHFCINGTSSVFAPLAPQAYTYFVYAMCALGAISIIYTLIKRDVKLLPAKNEVASKELSSIALVNSGTILFILVCCLLIVYNLFAPMIIK